MSETAITKQGENVKTTDPRNDEFLAILAHELRNPLAPISTAVEILHLKGSGSSEGRWALDTIGRQVHQMTRLIEDLLDIARLSSNTLELRNDHIDLREVFRMAEEASRPIIDAFDHKLSVSIPSEPVILKGDSIRLSQIISNLLNNASKYTERAGSIWLSAKVDGKEVAIEVKDTGEGIAPDTLPSIFELFAQVPHSSEHAQGGLGIGLTLVKRLVELHGGTITAKSPGLGKGSTFTVCLPIVEEDPDLTQKGKATLDRVSPLYSFRILVVDDNPSAAESMEKLLKIMGNETRRTYDGFEALTVAQDFRPDVILLDIGLPQMDGYEVARKIRAEMWGKKMVLIAVTGWGMDADRNLSKEAGIDHHLVKPVRSADLLKLLAAIEQSDHFL